MMSSFEISNKPAVRGVEGLGLFLQVSEASPFSVVLSLSLAVFGVAFGSMHGSPSGGLHEMFDGRSCKVGKESRVYFNDIG